MNEQAPQAPVHWEADVLLRDGSTAHLRPVGPEDADAFTQFYSRVSDESKYFRFFAPRPQLGEKEIARLINVDHHRRVGLVIVLRGRIVAVGRYEALEDPHVAEVAFLVEDAHHGRGIAQILLEHLAQAGRERGIERFVAEILAENKAMIRTFRDAGYQISTEYDHGVLALEFSIDPTETAIGVLRGREHRAEAASIRRFFSPRSVAIVGASRRQDTIGQVLVRNLVNGDFTGSVYAVNPTARAVSGLPAYRSVQDIPDEVDVAVVAVPAESVTDVVLDCAAKGVHGLVLISSGFAETGDEGRRRQRHLLGLSRSYGLRLVGPNCLGVINTDPAVSVNASLSRVMPPQGRAGFFCQSGALGSAILEKVRSRGLGLSSFISAGNRADVSGNDLLQYWEEDDRTELVLLYLESIGNPRKFSRIARRVSMKKPIIAVRSGRSTQGVPMGHAVRQIAAPTQAVDAMFRQAGVIQVDTLEEMFDVAQLLAHQPVPRGRRVAVVGNSDAIGLLAADAAAAVGLVVNRSVSLGADAGAEDFEDALDAAIDDPDVDSVIAVYIPPLNVSGEGVANVLAAVGEQSDKPLVTSFLGGEGIPELLRVPDVAGSTAGRGSVPSFPAVEAAARALAHVVDYSTWLRTPDGPSVISQGADPERAALLVRKITKSTEGQVELDQEELSKLLDAYDIALCPTTPVSSLDEALEAAGELWEAGESVVIKATAERLRSRPDLEHVWRSIDDSDELTLAWQTLTEALPEPDEAGFVVQRSAPTGLPLNISSVEDPLFGPVMSFGVSGPITSLLEDRAYRIPPLTGRDVSELVREIKASPLLFGYGGADPVDIADVERLVARVAELQNDLPEVRSLSLSLVLAGKNGAEVMTASATVERVSPDYGSMARRLPTVPGDTLPD